LLVVVPLLIKLLLLLLLCCFSPSRFARWQDQADCTVHAPALENDAVCPLAVSFSLLLT
jgi:hypothetical protein